jgi:hypothetical protein
MLMQFKKMLLIGTMSWVLVMAVITTSIGTAEAKGSPLAFKGRCGAMDFLSGHAPPGAPGPVHDFVSDIFHALLDLFACGF